MAQQINVSWPNLGQPEKEHEQHCTAAELSPLLASLLDNPAIEEIMVHKVDVKADKYTLFRRTSQGNVETVRWQESRGEFWAPERYDTDTEWLAACRKSGIHSIFEPDMSAQLAALRVR